METILLLHLFVWPNPDIGSQPRNDFDCRKAGSDVEQKATCASRYSPIARHIKLSLLVLATCGGALASRVLSYVFDIAAGPSLCDLKLRLIFLDKRQIGLPVPPLIVGDRGRWGFRQRSLGFKLDLE